MTELTVGIVRDTENRQVGGRQTIGYHGGIVKKVTIVLVPALLAASTYAKDKKVMLQVHAQANRKSLDSKNEHSENDIQVGQGDSSLQVWAALVTWDDRTVSATLQITKCRPATVPLRS